VTKNKIVLGLAMAVLLAGGTDALAQGRALSSGRAYLNINFGAQPQEREISTADTFTLYDEQATVETTQPIKSGPVFEVGGGYRIGRRLGVGASVTFLTAQKTASALQASIPDPIFYDQFKTVTVTTPGLAHQERGVHLRATWFQPITDKLDLALSGGPSFINVEQQLTTTVTVPVGTQEVQVLTGTENGTAVGINAGVDVRYMITQRIGVGLAVEYGGGSVDLPSVSDFGVGGLRTGFGLRLRF
jgi:hypothetical protein